MWDTPFHCIEPPELGNSSSKPCPKRSLDTLQICQIQTPSPSRISSDPGLPPCKCIRAASLSLSSHKCYQASNHEIPNTKPFNYIHVPSWCLPICWQHVFQHLRHNGLGQGDQETQKTLVQQLCKNKKNKTWKLTNKLDIMFNHFVYVFYIIMIQQVTILYMQRCDFSIPFLCATVNRDKLPTNSLSEWELILGPGENDQDLLESHHGATWIPLKFALHNFKDITKMTSIFCAWTNAPACTLTKGLTKSHKVLFVQIAQNLWWKRGRGMQDGMVNN